MVLLIGGDQGDTLAQCHVEAGLGGGVGGGGEI